MQWVFSILNKICFIPTAIPNVEYGALRLELFRVYPTLYRILNTGAHDLNYSGLGIVSPRCYGAVRRLDICAVGAQVPGTSGAAVLCRCCRPRRCCYGWCWLGFGVVVAGAVAPSALVVRPAGAFQRIVIEAAFARGCVGAVGIPPHLKWSLPPADRLGFRGRRGVAAVSQPLGFPVAPTRRCGRETVGVSGGVGRSRLRRDRWDLRRSRPLAVARGPQGFQWPEGIVCDCLDRGICTGFDRSRRLGAAGSSCARTRPVEKSRPTASDVIHVNNDRGGGRAAINEIFRTAFL